MSAARLSPHPHQRPRATDYLIASKRCELRNLERFLQMGKLVLSIGNLIHELQRERGASNVFLGSGGRRFSEELVEMIDSSLRQQDAFEHELMEIQGELTQDPASTSLLNSLAAALHGLESLPAIRQQIRHQSISAEAAIDAYIERIRHLLTVVFEAAETVVDPTIAGMMVAMVNLMQGKEMAGQERAAGSLGFSRGHFDHALSQRIMHLIDAQERAFPVFERFADEEMLALWKQHNREDFWQELKYLRGLACSVGRYRELDTDLADQWFDLMTRRIDELKNIECLLEEHFHRRCIGRYTEARNALTHEQNLMESLDDSGHSPDPVLVVCSSENGGDTSQYRSDGVGRKLGRSVFDLVQQQALRLDQLSGELRIAREALDDRRTLEKAVLLLMKHQQISDDEAHKQLRKVAMDQGRKLTEVARSVLEMTDLLR
ncbi:nitrate- and nitrite sensing domain-containing protein [Marinobacter zhanjiangensis]|uniref:Transcriptional regulator n=1 Tax=Marinobacter zhanjiangensis TaxID=578215 RepID=A0ABQ3AXH2_9GAMM|nr:nitrate- and nitrite sensing domain-containing protein [Marinobacter zhanjiangensis]GGY70327.1 transcriptional regulator [Marinobacter zhanjiangensis]